ALTALRAMTVLEDIISGTVTLDDLDLLGVRDAGAWDTLARTYFGPTRQRGLQSAAVAAAAGLSLDAVAVVEKHTKKLLRGAEVSQWELRVELCGLRGRRSTGRPPRWCVRTTAGSRTRRRKPGGRGP